MKPRERRRHQAAHVYFAPTRPSARRLSRLMGRSAELLSHCHQEWDNLLSALTATVWLAHAAFSSHRSHVNYIYTACTATCRSGWPVPAFKKYNSHSARCNLANALVMDGQHRWLLTGGRKKGKLRLRWCRKHTQRETHRCWGAWGDGRCEPRAPASGGLRRTGREWRLGGWCEQQRLGSLVTWSGDVRY